MTNHGIARAVVVGEMRGAGGVTVSGTGAAAEVVAAGLSDVTSAGSVISAGSVTSVVGRVVAVAGDWVAGHRRVAANRVRSRRSSRRGGSGSRSTRLPRRSS